MDDEETARIARTLLEDLGSRSSYGAKLLAVARVLHDVDARAREQTRAAFPRPDYRSTPGWNECLMLLRGPEDEAPPPSPPSAPTPPPRALKLTPDDLDQLRAGTTKRLVALAARAPGPATASIRRLAMTAAAAHLACQWGALEEARTTIGRVGGVLATLRERWQTPGGFQLEVMFAGLLMASSACERGHACLATGLTRRVTADLGAMARAAARLEGRPGLDMRFEGVLAESIGGVAPEVAKTMAVEFTRALGVHVPST